MRMRTQTHRVDPSTRPLAISACSRNHHVIKGEQFKYFFITEGIRATMFHVRIWQLSVEIQSIKAGMNIRP
jgi:hypothetical protein